MVVHFIDSKSVSSVANTSKVQTIRLQTRVLLKSGILNPNYSAWTFSNISGFVLSSPIVGYETADAFHATGLSVNSNLKAVRRTTSTTSDPQMWDQRGVHGKSVRASTLRRHSLISSCENLNPLDAHKESARKTVLPVKMT